LGSVNHCYRRCYRICHGITKDPSGNDYLLVFQCNVITCKLIDKLHNILNQLIDRNDLSAKTTESLNELLEMLKMLENCISCCKYKEIDENDLDEFLESINEIESYLAKLGKEEQKEEKDAIINELNKKLFEIDNKLNKKILYRDCCKEKEIRKLTDKCGNREIARCICDCKLNAKDHDNEYVWWIPFDEFKNIEYLAKGGFG